MVLALVAPRGRTLNARAMAAPRHNVVLRDRIEIGFQAFVSDGGEEFGAIREVLPGGLVVYVENAGDFTVPLSGEVTLGPFRIELITLTHSIPEPNALAIHTPLGTVVHTGDWKIDPDPLVGPVTDDASLRRLGDSGVLAMICDSTNAERLYLILLCFSSPAFFR